MLALNNHGDYHEGNVSWIGGYKGFDELQDVDRVIADETQTLEQVKLYAEAFELGTCSSCVTVADWKTFIAVGAVFLITLGNLRGLREAGNIFAIPTYVFLGMALLMIALGAYLISRTPRTD